MKKNYFKLGVFAVFMLAANLVNAQSAADGSSANTNAGANASDVIRLIDNKGTIKYLQSNNGITTITSTNAGNETTTTWQLGGTLLETTSIDANGNAFSIDVNGGTFVLENLLQESGAAATALDATGYTLITRDEATGETKRMLMSDLVKGGTHNGQAAVGTDFEYNGDATMPNDITKIWVYRNGVKLLAGVNYTISGGVGTTDVSVNFSSAVAGEEYNFVANDRIEIQWVQ